MKKYEVAIQYILVFLIAVVQYSNTANHEYAWDDAIVVVQNQRVQKGLSDIPELFQNIKTNETANRYGYRPLALLSFATDIELFEMKPGPAHKVSILLYGLLCMLVLLFIRKMFPEVGWAAFWVALLFAVHPLHSEVIANIKSRDEVLALIFGLSSLLVYRSALQRQTVWLFLPSAFLMILAFLSKESAVTLCGVAAILPWFVAGSNNISERIANAVPAVLFVMIFLGIRAYVYSYDFFQTNDFELAQKGLFHEDGFIGNPLFGATFSELVATAFYLCAYFVYRFINPYPLVHDYSYNQFSVMDWSMPIVWVSLVFALVLIFVSIQGILKQRPYGFGLGFFLITASVYFHLVEIAPDIFAERFVFVPSLGLCMAMVPLFGLQKFGKHFPKIIVAVVLVFFGYTWTRNKAWKNNDTLLETDLPKLKNCVRANYNYALQLHRQYYSLPEFERPVASLKVLKYYERTYQLTDRLFNVYMDLGAAYMEFGYPDKGREVFEKAIEKYPDLSMPYVQMGKYYMSYQRFDEAIPYFRSALELGSQNSDFHYLLAICLFNEEAYGEAIETLEEGEKLGVSSSAYYDLMGRLYAALSKYDEAIFALEKGLQRYPNDLGLQQRLESIKNR